jgi:ABC-2 type transport system permease protein
MTGLSRLIAVEAKLVFRDPAAWVIALLVPTGILVVLGLIPGLSRPDEAFGGDRFIDLFVPSLVVLTLATLGLTALPIRLATYREIGVLRRFSTTPARPASLLAAQLVVNVLVATAAVVLLVGVGYVGFGVPIPQHPLAFVAAFGLGMSSLFAIGLLVAAVARTTRVGTGLAMPIFVAVMFLGGVYLPRFFFPDFLQTIGEYTPPGVQSLFDAWSGTPPDIPQLAILALITVVAGAVAAKLFRWE